MKKVVFGALAIAAAATPAAYAETSGVVDAGYANSDYNTHTSFNGYHLGGAFQTDAWSGWSMQVDGATILQDWRNSPNWSHSYAAVHADTNTGGWDFGGWVGLLNYYGDGGWQFGGETRTSFDNISLQGSVGYANFNSYNDFSAWDLNVSGAYFINPNFAITANASGTWFNQSSSSDYTATEYGVGATYGCGNGFEFYGGYLRSQFDRHSGSGYDIN
ncbi:MAG: hypothetical protein JSS00_10390, partial [Proteobacteria bacterium]|nr:hypothetical protein [Pseudomonadota bacterium]